MGFALGVSSNIDIVAATLDGTARQLPFAMARTINASAKDFQKFQRNHMQNVFTVRRRNFVLRSVKIKPFANKRRLEATVSIDPPGGQRRADILVKFEEGGTKRSRRAGGSVAVPIAVRKSRQSIIRKRDRPRSFAFRKVGRSLRGKRRTFLIPGVGIYQRVGAKKAGRRLASSVKTRRVRDLNIRLLYSLRPSVEIPKSLRFIANAKKVVPRVFPGHFKTEFARALRTARR